MMRVVMRAAVTTGGGAMLGLVFSMLSFKVVSVVAGPAGVGAYSLLLQVLATATAFSTFGGGGAIAVVQGLASRDEHQRGRYIATAAWLFTAATLVAAIGLFSLAPLLRDLLDEAGALLTPRVLRAIVLPLVLGSFGVFLGAVLNGYRAIGALAVSRVLGSATIFLLIYPAAVAARDGRALGLVLVLAASTAMQALVSGVLLRRYVWPGAAAGPGRPALRRDDARHFATIAGAMFVAGQVSQGSVLLLNAQIVALFGLGGAGLFSAAWSLSMGYVLLILTSFGTFYLPAFAAARTDAERHELIATVLRVAVLAAVPLIAGVAVLKPMVVSLVYSAEFLGALDIMRWMLVGDYLKITAWVFAMPVTARGDMKVFVATEIGWYASLLVAGSALTRWLGRPEAVGMVFGAVYAVHLAYHVHYLHSRVGYRPAGRDVVVWIIGFLYILLVSILHWTDRAIHWAPATAWVAGGLLVAWFSLGAPLRRRVTTGLRARFRFRHA